MKVYTLLILSISSLPFVYCFQSPRLPANVRIARIPARSTTALLLPGGALFSKRRDDSFDSKIQGRRKRVTIGYQATAVTYLAATVAAMISMGVSAGSFHATSPSVAAAGCSFLLSRAAENNRLSSDTYKRLNLFLGSYSLIVLGSSAVYRNRGALLSAVASLLGIQNSIKGYGYGIKGWWLGPADPLKDLWNGVQFSCKRIVSVPKNLASVGYLLVFLFVGSIQVHDIMIAKQGGGILQFARLSLLAMLTFTLKDAADQSFLKGTTFIQLNIISMYVFGCYAATTKLDTTVGKAALACSLYSAFIGLYSSLQKKYR